MTDPVDVLIIGAGASGAAVAWSLADTRMRIVCMEQGDWHSSSRFPANHPDWESRAQEEYGFNPNRRRAAADYPVNDDASPIKIANFNGVGGGTVLFAGHFPRLLPSDFRVRSLDGVAEDWPIGYDTLEPFYDLNDRMMGVSGLQGDPAYPPKPPRHPPIPMGQSSARMGAAMNRLGWHWWPSDAAILTREDNGRAPCINLGQCLSGCAQGAKASTDLTYWPAAIAARVELRTRCRVSRIETDRNDRATGVHYVDETGQDRFQPAEIVILAGNGIGTPRLLLNSASDRFPDGLANTSGMVGRNLMLHPYSQITGRLPDRHDGNMGPVISTWSMQFYETDPGRDFLRGYCYQFFRGMGAVRTATEGLRDGGIPWGKGHHAAFRHRFGHMAGLFGICEDLPELHNTVTLDPDLRDADGIPAPRVTYTLSENSRRMLDHSIARGTEILAEAGATGITCRAPLPFAGWHLMGTARMGTDPGTSVVNPWGRSHDVRNLFIVDGSVFVTSGGVNPTSTIQAYALYVADQIKSRIHDLFD